MKRKPLYTTERLEVRHLHGDDLDAMLAVYGDEATMAPLGDDEILDRETCAAWIEKTRTNYETYGYGMSAVVLRETGEVIGFCGIVHPGGQEEPEVKYALRADRWGRGYGTEALIGMLRYGADALAIARLLATVHPDNHASQHVLRKAGFHEAAPRTEDDGSLTLVFEHHQPPAR